MYHRVHYQLRWWALWRHPHRGYRWWGMYWSWQRKDGVIVFGKTQTLQFALRQTLLVKSQW
jgi:hypothetical protein